MKKNGEWGTPTEQEEQLISLSAEVAKKMDALNHLSKTYKKKGKNDHFNRDRGNNSNWFNQPGNNSSAKSRKSAKEARNKWKKIPPSHGNPPTKLFESRTYMWCPNHQVWCMHDPKVCTNKPESTGTPRSSNRPKKSRQDKFFETLSTVMTQIDEGEENDSEE